MFHFVKVNGLGNSFIVFDEFNLDLSILKKPSAIRVLCSQSYGIGADGVIFMKSPSNSSCHFNMQIFNSDGSEAEMCGNGLRCASMLYDLHRPLSEAMLDKHDNRRPMAMFAETKAGIKSSRFIKKDESELFYEVEMGTPEFNLYKTGELSLHCECLELEGVCFKPVYVNVGNPHAVIFIDKPLEHSFLCRAGAFIERHKNHLRGINVEFVRIISRGEVFADVWERSCGITQACGTGACAAAAAGIKEGLLEKEVKVNMPGGQLIIKQNEEGTLLMTASATETASGQLSTMLFNKIKKLA